MTTSLQRERVSAHFFPALSGLARGLALAAFFLAGTCQAADGWLTSYDQAMKAAEQTGRPVLTVFTGSDWCTHCHRLEEQVLNTDHFSQWARERVVLLVIDLPQQGLSQDERHARSRVCVKYGVKSFPTAVLIGPDGARITAQTGYQGQSAEAWVTAMQGHLPAVADQTPASDDEEVLSSLDKAVETARDAKRPILLMVSRSGDAGASTRVASLIKDPEFETLARDHFVVATVPSPADQPAAAATELEDLLGGAEIPTDGLELIVTDDGRTPLYSQSGAQAPHRIVSGLRRYLAARQAVRR